MSKAKQTLTKAFLERVSRGAVPMGGFYWIDPKTLRSRNSDAGASPRVPAEASATKALQPGAMALQPGAMALQPGAMALQPSAIPWRPVALIQRIGLFLIGAHASIREPSETMSGGTQHAPGEQS